MNEPLLSNEIIETLPAVNAALNSFAAALLVIGWCFIKQGKTIAHRNVMISAFLVSALFLASYLTYHFHHVATPFPGQGVWRWIYFAILVPHIILAAAMLPMILLTFVRAFRGDYARHVRIARITLPVWLYVSVTGVIVYVMLYRIAWE